MKIIENFITKSRQTNQRAAFGKEEELVIERTNQRAAFGKEEELVIERTNQRAAFGKAEELEIERTNQRAPKGMMSHILSPVVLVIHQLTLLIVDSLGH